MRKTENEKSQGREASETKKVYHKTRGKASKKESTDKRKQASAKRELRRQKAIKAVAIKELLIELKLEKNESYVCPACKSKDSLTLNPDKCEFSCSNCKQKGNSIKVVKLARGLSDWKAIAYIEELSNSQKSSTEQSASSSEESSEKESSTCPLCEAENSIVVNQEKGTRHCQACLEKIPEPQKNSPEPTESTPPPAEATDFPPKRSSKPSKSGCIPEEELEIIKRDIDLAVLVRAEGIELKRQGKNLVGLCPLHADKKPSLVISPNNLWHCFGCGRGGTNIDWIMELKKVGFREAVEFLREQYPRVCVSSRSEEGVRAAKVSRETYPVEMGADDQRLLRQVISYYQESLKQTPAALAYLEKRGLKDAQMLEYFRIGFADRSLGKRLPGGHAKEGKEIRERLINLGIIRQSGHEHFAGSIVIPIMDARANITEIYGRKINDNLRQGTAYHMYLPGPHKGIFNPASLESGGVILCESLIDAMSFWVQGFKNVTASYGTQGFTEEHLKAFSSHQVKKVFIAYDADVAGDKASQKLAEKLLPQGIECYRVVFPWGKDANELICESKNPKLELQKILQQAVKLEGTLPSLAAQITAAKEKKTSAQTSAASQKSVTYSLRPEKEDAANQKNITIPDKHKLCPEIKGEVIEINIHERVYRIRGLKKNLSFDNMRVNIRVAQEDRLHVDTLELYNARQRNLFIKTVALELGIKPEIIKYDVNRILLCLEQLQIQYIEEAINPRKKEVEMSKKEEQEAKAFLMNRNLLGIIIRDFNKVGLVGEDTNALVCYLALTSRLLNDPLAIIIQALSGAGKSALMNTALSFIPEEGVVKYTAMTGQSLFYMGENELVHKILAISEEEGAEKAAYSLKIMQSEKGLSIASTGKDPKTGRFLTHEYKVKGPVQIILTTTAIIIDEELQNRCLVLTVNEGRIQTQAIHKLQRARETLKGMLREHERERIIKLHQNAQRLLKPIMVVNPYAENLTFLDSRLRSRRDQIKYLTLIRSIALLHQYQRPIKKTQFQGEEISYIEVTLEDIDTANRLISEVLGTSLDELAPQTRRFPQSPPRDGTGAL